MWWWLLGGVILGCGVLGKYTMGLAALAGSASFLFAGPPRRWLPGYLVHALVAVATASPILIHNIPHDFAPIRYQWAHSMSSPQPGIAPFAEFVGVQILLFGGVPFAILFWGFRNWRELVGRPAPARLRVPVPPAVLVLSLQGDARAARGELGVPVLHRLLAAGGESGSRASRTGGAGGSRRGPGSPCRWGSRRR